MKLARTKCKKTTSAVTALVLGAFVAMGSHAQEEQLEGCYKPIRGFATSLCTDGDACTEQSGIYKIVLHNAQAPFGQRTLAMSGLFEGLLTVMPNACGAATAQHVLTDRDKVSSITTGPDVACFTGGGDFVNTIEIIETLEVTEGTGVYAGLVPGGTVTLTGKLGLKTGINTFKVTPLPGDEICFGA